MRMMISMDDDLVQKVDDFADRNYSTRSGVITRAVAQLLAQDECSTALTKLALSMERIANNNNVVDEQSKKDLEELKALASLFSNN